MTQQGHIETQQHEQDFAYVDSLITGHTKSFVQMASAQIEECSVPAVLCLTTFSNHTEILNRCKDIEDAYSTCIANFSRLNISKMNMKRYDTYKDSGVRWLVPCSLECDTDGLLDEIMK